MWTNKVIWTEGMFLQPQHFQQQDRYLHALVEQRAQGLRPYPWGFIDLALDEASLAAGKVALQSARGVMPDGSVFDIPAAQEAPAALEIPAEAKSVTVMLALPRQRVNVNEVANGSDAESLARWRAHEYTVRDSNAEMENNESLMQVGQLRLQLALETETLGEFVAMGVARVLEKQHDQRLVLDANFIPPALDYQAAKRLVAFVGELRALLHQRGETYKEQVMGMRAGVVAEVQDILLLQLINRYQPLFTHIAALRGLHPETLYQTCLMLAGELATFARNERRPIEYQPYRHHDLWSSYAPLIEDLRRSLSIVPERNAIAIPLEEKKFGIRIGICPERSLLRDATFVLAVNARTPADVLRQRFPTQTKVGPVEKIRDLVNLALPGIRLHALPVAPRQIPFHAGYTYFELDRASELWKSLDESGGFAIHVAGEFPELSLEFWAIRG